MEIVKSYSIIPSNSLRTYGNHRRVRVIVSILPAQKGRNITATGVARGSVNAQ